MRRVFIILVLLGLAFVIYNYLNPEGGRAIISKVETTWDSVFSKSVVVEEPILTGNDLSGTVATGSLVPDLFGTSTGEITSGDLAETDEWLKELNEEIKEMIAEDTGEQPVLITGTVSVAPCSKEGIVTNIELGGTPCCEGLSEFVAPQGIWLSVDPGSLCYDAKKGLPICKYNGTAKEGWYQVDTLLFLDNCDATVVKTTTPTVSTPRTSSSSEYKDTQHLFDTFFQ